MVDFGLIWRLFCKKILRAVSERTALPTNQPTNYQQHGFSRTWLTPVQKRKLRLTIEGRPFDLISNKNKNIKIQHLYKNIDENIIKGSFQPSSPRVCLEGDHYQFVSTRGINPGNFSPYLFYINF